jgi:TonB family protein
VNRVVPRYSTSLIKAGQPEQVIAHLFIDEKGHVMEAGIGKSSNRNLDAPSIEAVRQWRFVPASLNGKPVISWTAAPINFEASTAIDPIGPPENSVLPRLKQTSPAVHPYDLAIAGKTGSAAVSVFIGRDGAVLKTNILRASELEFGFAFAAAIETWKFEPGTTNGRPVRVTMTQRQDFRAGKPGSSIDKETAELAARIRSGKFKPASEQDLDAPIRVQAEVTPVFPTALLERQRDGTATIEVIVDKKGRAMLPRIVEASEPEFGWAAATAAQRWLFVAPTVNGEPAEVVVAIPFKFNPPEP